MTRRCRHRDLALTFGPHHKAMNWLTRLFAHLLRRPNLWPSHWRYEGESCTSTAHTLTERELRHSRLRAARTPLELLAQ